jgi:hypothetical protein
LKALPCGFGCIMRNLISGRVLIAEESPAGRLAPRLDMLGVVY